MAWALHPGCPGIPAGTKEMLIFDSTGCRSERRCAMKSTWNKPFVAHLVRVARPGVVGIHVAEITRIERLPSVCWSRKAGRRSCPRPPSAGASARALRIELDTTPRIANTAHEKNRDRNHHLQQREGRRRRSESGDPTIHARPRHRNFRLRFSSCASLHLPNRCGSVSTTGRPVVISSEIARQSLSADRRISVISSLVPFGKKPHPRHIRISVLKQVDVEHLNADIIGQLDRRARASRLAPASPLAAPAALNFEAAFQRMKHHIVVSARP